MNTFNARWIIAAALLSAAASAVHADFVRYVDDDAAPRGDGTSWATAYRFLQSALACASDPQCDVVEIRVAGGVYLPDRDEAGPGGSGSRQASFELTGDVVVRGGHLGLSAGPGDSPDERDLLGHPSILTGDLAGDDGPGFAGNGENSYHVVTAPFGAVAPTLDGFTVTAGNADGASPRDRGGGLYVDGSAPVVLRCTFAGNAAGGLFGRGGAVYSLLGDPLFRKCTFTGNVAAAEGGAMFIAPTSRPTVVRCTFDGNAASDRGGAMRNNASDPTVANCLFVGNSAVEGGGMHNTGPSAPIVVGCVFEGNTAGSRGGAMFNIAAANPDVVRSTFTANTAGTEGGGMRNLSSHPTVTNCDFTGNHAPNGGGMANRTSSPTLQACRFDGNTASLGGGLYNVMQSDPIVTGCAFSGNIADGGTGGAMHNHSSSPEVVRCAFVGNWASDGGAIGNDQGSSPLLDACSFIDNTAELLGGAVFSHYGGAPVVSSCAFTGNNAGVAGGGLASVLYSTPEVSGTLLCDNDPNQIEGDWADDGGNEMAETCRETCPGDLTGDGLVNMTDLLVLLVGWGPCPAGCVGDLNGDGSVGVIDLLWMMGAWGPCPSLRAGSGPPPAHVRVRRRAAFR